MKASLLLFFVMAGCEASPPPKAPHTQETVPANSLDKSKLDGTPNDVDPNPTSDDPAPAKEVDDAAPASGKKTVSNADCGRAMDRYLELEIATNPQLRGVPHEVVEQAKATARAQHGDAPCTATAAQYRCAMAATTTAGWQKCMK